MRRVVAFAMMPFVGAALAYAGAPLFAASLSKQIGATFSDDMAGSFAAGAFFVIVLVTAFGALPLFAWMNERGQITYKQCLVAGIGFGNAPFLIISAIIVLVHAFKGAVVDSNAMWYGATGMVRTITTGTLIGAALGSVFWFVGVRED